MVRFLSGFAPGWRQVRMPPAPSLAGAAVVALALVAVPAGTPHFLAGARGILNAVVFGVAIVSWIAFVFGRDHDRVFIAALAVLGASGGVLAGLSDLTPAIAIGCVVTATAGSRVRPGDSLAITAATVAAFLVTGLASGAAAGQLIGYPCAFVGLWGFGQTRHAFLERAEQAERMLEQTRRARKAETEAAALAERARIAREIHDVLAHSLAAVSVNLQAAEGLLADLPDKNAELVKAIECIERAGVFTREGLTEARRAINALRDVASPLPEQLKALAARHGEDGDTEVGFSMSGSPRPVPPDANLTAFRTAQEALTNARKHSPGQPVRLRLEFAPAEIALLVTNPLPAAPAAPASLASTGGGHGLTGLRERAALSGGTLTAGPADGQWQVCLRIPA